MLKEAAGILRHSRRTAAFTGAGISVESGVPAFRGEDGLWSKYDPKCLEIGYFHAHPEEAWVVIKEIFYDFFGGAEPNPAHRGLALMEEHGLLQTVITQNIDNLHQAAGSREVYEFHGNSHQLVCLSCGRSCTVTEVDLSELPPKCERCRGLLKPDFVFFGEAIPERPMSRALFEAQRADVFLVIGTTGEVMPAAMVPATAKQHGATIIEVNLEESNYTGEITDIFLQGRAGEVMTALISELGLA